MRFLKHLRGCHEETHPETSVSRKNDSPSASEGAAAEESPIKPKMTKMFDIKLILESHIGGEEIVEHMNEGLLPHKSRVQAVRILVSYLIEHHGERPSSEIKTAMARSIITQFPRLHDEDGEGFEAWYTSGKNRHCATGYLEERLRNVRKRSKNRAPVVKSIPTTTEGVLHAHLMTDETTAEDISNMTLWLKHNKEPVSMVKDFMAKTARSRAMFLRENAEETVESFLQEYPRLIDTPGMIEQDFRLVMPNSADNLFMKWGTMYDSILQYADKQSNWGQYLRVSTPSTDEQKENLALMVLPCIFPTGVKRAKGKSKRATVDEAIKSLIDVKPIGSNLPTYLERATQNEPYILLLGEVLTPEQVFVIVQGRAIQASSSLLKGLDLCFKLYYILDICYPWQCATTWEFFQKVVYRLGEDQGSGYTSGCIRSIRAYLKNKQCGQQ